MRAGGALTRLALAVVLVVGASDFGVTDAAGQGRVPTQRDVTTPELPVPRPLDQDKGVEGLERPVLPPPGPPRPMAQVGDLRVQRFDIRGNTVFSDADFAPLLERYLNRPVSYEDLEELRSQLTRCYVEAGYISSGAVLPDQRVVDGVVRIDIIEGRLVDVEVSGTKWFSAEYVRDWVSSMVTEPVNIDQLHQALDLLTRDQRMQRIRAELRPTARLGQSVLHLEVVDHHPLRAGLDASNWTQPSVGEAGGKLTLTYDNVLGRAQEANIYSEFTEGVVNVGGRYAIPLPGFRLLLAGFGEYARNRVIQKPFNHLDIESESVTYGVNVTYTLSETPESRQALQIGIDHTDTTSSLLGIDFSFVPGAHDGQTAVTPLRIAYEGTRRGERTAMAARLRLSQGLDLLDATHNPGKLPDTDFTTLLCQLQLLRSLGRVASLLVRLDAQYSFNALFPTEQIAAGGHDTVRGYPESYVTGDNGAVGSLELRFPLLARRGGAPLLESSVFTEGAVLDIVGRPNPQITTLVSVGTGLRWRPNPYLEARLDIGVPLRAEAPDTGDAQDYGIHFGVTTDLRPWELLTQDSR